MHQLTFLKNKKSPSTWIGLAVGSIIFIAILLNMELPRRLTDFYFQTLNPKAGVVKLEKQYKDAYDSAYSSLQESGMTITEMQEKSDDQNNKGNMTAFTNYYSGKLLYQFSARDTDFVNMLAIDDSALNLNLPMEYKQFFQKRKKADEKDYDGFKTYRTGMTHLMDGTIAYYSFYDLYSDVMVKLYPTDNKQAYYSDQNNTAIIGKEALLDTQFNKIQTLKDQDIYTTEIYNSLATSQLEVQLFRELYVGYRTDDPKTVNDATNKLNTNNPKLTTQDQDVTIFLNWSKEKIQPYFYSQDTKHGQASDLYRQAYSYAKIQKLDEVFSLWKNQAPGSSDTGKTS